MTRETRTTCMNVLQNRRGGGFPIYYYRKDPRFLSLGVPPHTHTPTRFAMPMARGKTFSMPETGEKERNYLFKSYTDLE